MDFDYGVIIGLIVTASGAAVLGLSYLGAYLMGHSRGRREAEREQREIGYSLPDDRTAAIEGALSTMAQAIERLTDAQRIALLDRVRVASEPRTPGSRAGQRNTPA